MSNNTFVSRDFTNGYFLKQYIDAKAGPYICNKALKLPGTTNYVDKPEFIKQAMPLTTALHEEAFGSVYNFPFDIMNGGHTLSKVDTASSSHNNVYLNPAVAGEADIIRKMQKWFVGDCVTFYDPNKFQSGERDPALQLTHGGTYYIRKIAHRFLNDKKPSANGLIDNPLRDIFKEQNNLNTDVMECKWASEVLDANYNISTRNPYSDLKDATISYGFIQLSATPDGPPISCMDIEKDGRGLQYSELDSTKSTAHNTFWGKQQPTTSSGATTPGNDKKEFGRIMPNNMSIAKHVHFRKELTTYPKNSFDRGVMFLAREHFDSFITSDVTIEGGLTFDTRVDKYLPSGTPVVYDSNGGTPIPELVEGQIYYTLRGSSGLTAGTGADRSGGARARHIRLSATKNGPAIVIGNGRGAGYTKENEPTTSEYGNALAAPGDNTEKAIPDYYSVHGTDASIGQNKQVKVLKKQLQWVYN